MKRLKITLLFTLFLFTNYILQSQCVPNTFPVNANGNYYGQCQSGNISGETAVCNNADITFTLDLGFPPTTNHDEIFLVYWVVGDFGDSGSNNPKDEWLWGNQLGNNSITVITEYDNASGRHLQLRLNSGNNLIYNRIAASGGIDCRFSYEWQGNQAVTQRYYTSKKFFDNDKDPIARMKINDLNTTWIESHSGQNGFVADLSDSESCGEGYKIWMNKRDFWGNSLPNEPWHFYNYPGYPPSNLKLKDVGSVLGLSWSPGDNYAVRLTVNGNNIWTEDIHFIRIKQSISISNVYSLNANEVIKKTATPWGLKKYQYFENTTPLGTSLIPIIMLNGTDSQFEDGQYISIREFNPLTWTYGNTLYAQWYSSTGEITFYHPLNFPPFNAFFIPGQFYMITHAVGPQWDADNHLVKIGPWTPKQDEETGDPSERSVDSDDKEMFDIWPNPSQGLVNIANRGNNEIFSIEVYDLTGKKVFQRKYIGDDQTIVDLSELPKGAYIISILTSETRQSQKLILH